MKKITKEEYLVGVINSIATKYPDLRYDSKAPTFALQYMGTAFTLHKRSGFPMPQAIAIENSFHELYAVSDEFNERNKQFMIEHGYIECAFGLKLRTPIIAKCVMGTSKTPYEADREVRSANNAVTQSWGMLLNRAMIAVNRRIEASKYRFDIFPVNMIHDAGYFKFREDPKVIQFLNNVLIEEMQWNDHDKIRSTEVPMMASLEIGKSWDKQFELPNNASIEEINDVISTISGPE
jgi:DNA polymerase I